MKNESGFTLIEMLIVLFIITVLILITVPNITKHMKSIDEKGCEGYLHLVEAQVEAYKMEHDDIPTIQVLKKEGYLKENANACSKEIVINEETGEVSFKEESDTDSNDS